MPICIYCRRVKEATEFSLEHVIPQALGGDFAPAAFSTNDACRWCNNILGQFVDASFSKSWFIDNWLTMTLMECYDADNPTDLRLLCMGVSEMRLPEMEDDEVVECYRGPFAENIYWVRPADDDLYWMNGGNPVRSKQRETRAYYTLHARSKTDFLIPLRTFRDSFRNRNVRKVFATDIKTNLIELGVFSEPDELDIRRIAALWEHDKRAVEAVEIRAKLNFDHRFMCKLARGVSYCLLGEKVLSGEYAEQIQIGLWSQNNDLQLQVRGTDLMSGLQRPENKLIGIKLAVTISIMALPEGLSVNISLGERYCSSILAVPREIMNEDDYRRIGNGIHVVLYPGLKQAYQLTTSQLVGHKLHNSHIGLRAAEAEIERRGKYFARMAALNRAREAEEGADTNLLPPVSE